MNDTRDRPQPKQKTAAQALSALMRYCSRAERSSGDALRLMRKWNIADGEAREILVSLHRERFIDDTRFAEAFVRDKSRLAGWGPYKISSGLKSKGISQDIISAALAGMESGEPEKKLRSVLEKKAAEAKGTVYERKGKLMRYALSRGFGYDTALKICEEILKDDE